MEISTHSPNHHHNLFHQYLCHFQKYPPTSLHIRPDLSLENWWLNNPLLSCLKANKLPYNFSVLFVGMHLSFIIVSCHQALVHSNIRLLRILLINCLLMSWWASPFVDVHVLLNIVFFFLSSRSPGYYEVQILFLVLLSIIYLNVSDQRIICIYI